ncbi:MAG: hypothetical protein GDA46_05975 [Bdellovibrionales bacterium]|nr:hypothetical protein [Bdellovibrionales bacterium]
MFNTLKEKYKPKLCSELNKNSDESEEDLDTCLLDDYVYSSLKVNCKKYKDRAKECCQNPRQCNPTMDILKPALALTPTLLATFSSIMTAGKSKGLSPQQIYDRQCKGANILQLGSFSSKVMSRVFPLLEKDCASKIKTCKENCNHLVTQFKKDFRTAYSPILSKYNIHYATKLAKKCLFQEEEDFDDILFNENSNKVNTMPRISSPKPGNNYCYWTAGADLKPTSNGKALDSDTISLLTQILYYSKTYYNTMKERSSNFVFKDTEIINCSDQKDRILTPNPKYTANKPLPPPVLKICKQVLERNYQRPTNPTHTLPPSNNNTSSLTGGTTSQKSQPYNHPLLPNPQEDTDFIPSDYDSPENSNLAKNLPGFKAGGGTGHAGGGGGAGISGGGGGLPGNDDSSQVDDFDGNVDSGGAAIGNFSANSSQEGYNSSNPEKLETDESSNNRNPGSETKETSDKKDDSSSDEESLKPTTIFEIASKNIQTLCSSFNCEL